MEPGVYLQYVYEGWPYLQSEVMPKQNCGVGTRDLSGIALLVRNLVAVVCGQYFYVMNASTLSPFSEGGFVTKSSDFESEDPVVMRSSADNFQTGYSAYVFVALSSSLWVFMENHPVASWNPWNLWSTTGSTEILDFVVFSMLFIFGTKLIFRSDSNSGVSCVSKDSNTAIGVYLHTLVDLSTGTWSTSEILSWSDTSTSCSLAVGDVFDINGDDFIVAVTETPTLFWFTLISNSVWKPHNVSVLSPNPTPHSLVIAFSE